MKDTISTSPLDDLEARILTLKKFEKKIRIALDHGGNTHSFDFICSQVLGGSMLMVYNFHAVLIIDIMNYPCRKVLHVVIAAGELDSALELSDQLPSLARRYGCEAIEMSGRKGWLPSLTKRGWREAAIVMTKEVSYE